MIYFDNAATTRFKPKCVIKAFSSELSNSANGGRSGHKDAVNTALRISKVRETLSSLFSADEIIFTKNCTEALNLAIFSATAKGGHVVTTVNEHNSVLRPLFKLEREKKISLSVVNPDANLAICPEHIARIITPKTVLVAVNAISNVTGAVADINAIGKICAEKGVPFLVDGAQAVPHLKINMKEDNITFLGCAGHKGFHAPQGTGFLAINGEFKMSPLLYGGTGTSSDSVYQPYSLPETLEAGTLNSPGIIALGEGAKWTYKNLDKIREKIEEISSVLLGGLKAMKTLEVYTPDGSLSGVISFNIKGKESTEVGDILSDKYRVAARTGLHCAPLIHNHLGTLDRGAVRLSVGYNNTLNEAAYIVDCIKKISF